MKFDAFLAFIFWVRFICFGEKTLVHEIKLSLSAGLELHSDFHLALL